MIRNDGRTPEKIRQVKLERDYLKYAEGSVLFDLGGTRVLCAASVDYSVPGWLRGTGLGWVTAEYSMLPRATKVRTKREAQTGRPSGRTNEIQRLIGRSLRAVVDREKMGGEVTVTLDCDVINADGGTRTAAVTAAFIALSDAFSHLEREGNIEQSPIRNFMAAVSVGVIGDIACLDLDYSEDAAAEVDMNVVMDDAGRLIELQGTAEKEPFGRQSLVEMLDLAEAGIRELIEIQRRALGR